VGSCSISSPSGVAPNILLEENVLPDAPLATSIAFDTEFDIVFANFLLFEEPEFTLIPLPLLHLHQSKPGYCCRPISDNQ